MKAALDRGQVVSLVLVGSLLLVAGGLAWLGLGALGEKQAEAQALPELDAFLNQYPQEYVELAEINMRYEGYISREREMVEKMNRLEEVHLHADFNYQQLNSLSAEAREKLSKLKPRTIGQASRISGVSPADISVLLVHLGR
jgi:tRNA uridine 5-carboxymethylaminomethyl modification enzyme